MILQKIKKMMRWLEPPRFDEDEEKSHRAKLLNAITLGFIVFMIIFLPFILPSHKIPLSTKILDVIILIDGLVLRHWLLKGRVKEVAFWTIFSGFFLVSGTIISLGTIRTPTTATYLCLVIASGILYDTKGIISTAIVSSLLVGLFAYVFNMGIFPDPVITTEFTHWIMYVLIFGLTGALINFSQKTTIRALEQSKMENTERLQAETRLRASESRFRNLFEQTHDAVFIIDLQGHYQAANQRAADILGYSIDEILSLSCTDISMDADETMEIFSRLLSGENIANYERYFHKKDGKVFPVEINIELVKDNHGNPLHVQSVVRDISQRKQVEKELQATNEQLNTRIAEVEQLHLELKEQAIRDPLTGLYNRRFLNETLPREIARVEREQNYLSIILADIDHFKQFNDTYGHQAGDEILVEIANHLKKVTRASDIICRYGGEEFLMVLPGSTIEIAQNRADEIRQSIENNIIQYKDLLLKTTISLGVAAFPNNGKAAEEIINKADQAMYQSKLTGRNRVTVWSDKFKINNHS